MKTGTGLRLKAKQESLKTGPVFSLLRQWQGILLGVILVAVIGAGLKISQEPRSTLPISRDDLELFDHDNKDGTYTTYTATNAYARYGTIDWLGPTNMISMTNQEYFFLVTGAGVGDCYISNICNVSAISNTAPPVVLTVVNNTAGATNITVRWGAWGESPDGSRSLVITNGQLGIISLRVNQRAAVGAKGTNVIGKIFF